MFSFHGEKQLIWTLIIGGYNVIMIEFFKKDAQILETKVDDVHFYREMEAEKCKRKYNLPKHKHR